MKTDKLKAYQSSTVGLFRVFGPPLGKLQKNHYLYGKRLFFLVARPLRGGGGGVRA